MCIGVNTIEPYSKYKFCILLTTCYNRQNYTDIQKNEIQTLYRNVIYDWLHRTDLSIFIIDSSGYTYPEFSNTRLRVCSFIFPQNRSSTVAEGNSINYALDNLKELSNYDYVIKITGKYYIPNMKGILSKTANGSDFMFQNIRINNDLIQNSEVFGFKYKLGKEIVNPIVSEGYNKIMEERLGEIVTSGDYTYSRFPSMVNFYSSKRGNNSILNLL
jgi:hypothetical protein